MAVASALTAACLTAGAGTTHTLSSHGSKGGDGIFRVSLAGEPRSLNPNVAPVDDYALVVSQNIFSKLVSLADDGNVLPDVAERWDTSADRRTYTFHIRRGIRFHDGRPLTVDDVRATFARIGESANSEVARSIARVEVVDEWTIRITLKAPWAAFIPTLGWFGTSILPAHVYGGTAWRDRPANMRPIGSGPFKFTAWEPGRRIVLEKNGDYFGQGPYVDELEYVITSSTAAGVQLLIDGRIDYLLGRAPTTAVVRLSHTPGIHVSTAPSDGRAYLAFNLRRAPFSDLRARRAVNAGIDRRRLIDRVLDGLGTPAVGFYTPSVPWAYNGAARVPDYDPGEAKRLLSAVTRDAAGANRITFAYPGQPGAAPGALATEIIAELERIGFIVRANPVTPNTYVEWLGRERDFDAVILTGNQGPDPDTLSARFGSAGSMQIMGYTNRDLDAVLARGREEADPAARAGAYFRAQEILAADLPIAPLYEAVRVSAFREGVRGLPFEDARGLTADYTFNLVRLPRSGAPPSATAGVAGSRRP